jgi:hypothetical protein
VREKERKKEAASEQPFTLFDGKRREREHKSIFWMEREREREREPLLPSFTQSG